MSIDKRTQHSLFLQWIRHFHVVHVTTGEDTRQCLWHWSCPSINQMNRNDMNINRIALDFCDWQDGISICDRKAAHIKWYIKGFMNEGDSVLNASDFKAALENKINKVQVIVSLQPNHQKCCWYYKTSFSFLISVITKKVWLLGSNMRSDKAKEWIMILQELI